MKTKQTKRQHIAQAKKDLKRSTRVNGMWNYWLRDDGELFAQYQLGAGAWFILEKQDTKIYLVGANK